MELQNRRPVVPQGQDRYPEISTVFNSVNTLNKCRIKAKNCNNYSTISISNNEKNSFFLTVTTNIYENIIFKCHCMGNSEIRRLIFKN